MRAAALAPGLRGTAVALAAALGLTAFAPPVRAGGDVVFLLGEDHRGASPYFAAAAAYHARTAPDAHLVASVRSLAEVREYLVRHRGATAWDDVTLVVHGAPWMGLQTAVHVGGERASLEAIEAAARTGEFPPLPAGTLAPTGTLRLESCGLGRRPELVAAVATLFGVEARTQLVASRQFVAYRIDGDVATRLELPFVSTIVPGDARGRGRDGAVAALRREFAAHGGDAADAAVLEEIPISFGAAFPERLPRDAAARRARIAADRAVAARLRSYGLDAAGLEWIDQPPAAGEKARVEGRGTLLVLRAGGGPPLPVAP